MIFKCCVLLCFITLQLINLSNSAPNPQSLLDRFIESFNKRDCKIPIQIVLQKESSTTSQDDGKDSPYNLAIPLAVCDATTREENRDYAMCNEVFELMDNISTCVLNETVIGKIKNSIDIAFEDEVCDGFWKYKDIFVNHEDYVAFKLTNKDFCNIICSETEIRNACRFLLWSHRVHDAIYGQLKNVKVEESNDQSPKPQKNIDEGEAGNGNSQIVKKSDENSALSTTPAEKKEEDGGAQVVQQEKHLVDVAESKSAPLTEKSKDKPQYPKINEVPKAQSTITTQKNAANSVSTGVPEQSTDPKGTVNISQGRGSSNESFSKAPGNQASSSIGAILPATMGKISSTVETTLNKIANVSSSQDTSPQSVNNEEPIQISENQEVEEKTSNKDVSTHQESPDKKNITLSTNNDASSLKHGSDTTSTAIHTKATASTKKTDATSHENSAKDGLDTKKIDSVAVDDTKTKDEKSTVNTDKEANEKATKDGLDTKKINSVEVDDTKTKNEKSTENIDKEADMNNDLFDDKDVATNIISDTDDEDEFAVPEPMDNQGDVEEEKDFTPNPEKSEGQATKSSENSQVLPVDDIQSMNGINPFPEQEDTHFFFYFLSIILVIVGSYLVFHNKQKIIALIIEGRHEKKRRAQNISYKKLDTK